MSQYGAVYEADLL